MKLNNHEKQEFMKHYTDKDGNVGGGLIGWFISKNNLDYDYYHSIVCESLIKAIKTHDENKGSISNLFYNIAKNDVNNENIKIYREREYLGFLDTIEVDMNLQYNDYHEFNLIDIINNIDLTNREKRILDMIINGENQNYISNILGVSTRTVRRDIVKIREKMKDIKEDLY